jgi:hypothetical protein
LLLAPQCPVTYVLSDRERERGGRPTLPVPRTV